RAAGAPGRVVAPLYGAALAIEVTARAVAVTSYPGYWIQLVSFGVGLARAVLAFAWLYVAWKGIPKSRRGTITPRRAAFSLLIPFYDAYWALAVNVALCDTLDSMLERTRSEHRAPRVLAVVAGVAWLGFWVIGAAVGASGHHLPLLQEVVMPAASG